MVITTLHRTTFLKLLVLLSLGKTKLEYFMRQNNTASANVNNLSF